MTSLLHALCAFIREKCQGEIAMLIASSRLNPTENEFD